MDVIKYFATNNKTKKFIFVVQKYPIIKEIVDVLKVVHETTIELQKKNCTLSDFYARWIKMKLKIEKMKVSHRLTNLPLNLEQELLKRENSLFKNRAMLCAIYLDRRFTSQLTNEETFLVKETLYSLFERIQLVKEDHDISTDYDEAKNNSDNLLQEYITTQDIQARTQSVIHIASSGDQLANTTVGNHTRITKTHLMLAFDNYEKMRPADIKVSALNQWKEYKKKFPEIAELASVVLAIPPSQSSVERSFSALAIMLNSKSCKISQSILEHKLLIKINQDMVESIFAENEIKNLESKLQ